MSWTTLQRALDLVLASDDPNPLVVFSGGEPLLQFPLIRRAVTYFRERRPPGRRGRFGLSTNGTLIDSEVAAFLADNEFETHISFDGAPEAQDLRQIGTFETLDCLLDTLRTGHPAFFDDSLTINLTLVPEAIPFLAESVRYLLDKDVRQIAAYPAITPNSAWRDLMIDELDEQFRRVFQICLGQFYRTNNMPLLLFRKDPGELFHRTGSRLVCGMLCGKSLAVDVDGQAYRCAPAAESHHRLSGVELQMGWLRMGNIAASGFRLGCRRLPDPSQGAESSLRKDSKYSSYGRCADCRFFDTCETCPLLMWSDPGVSDPRRVPDFLCAFNKVALYYRDLLPARPTRLDVLFAADAALNAPAADCSRPRPTRCD